MLIEGDVFTDSTPTIVDCDLLEAAKENVQPLGTGRRVTALSAILATPHAQRDLKLSATRNRLRINVEIALDDEDGDPLDAYCSLIYWTIENYPQGPSVESGLLELLEEATRVLKDDRGGKWRMDLKYLKLWLLYASFVERPFLIYKFLMANEIGTEFALLYEEYAAVLERDGRRKDADDVYALGIARRASPLDHLKIRHDDFQKRMMSNLQLPLAPPSTQPSASARPALAPATRSGTTTGGLSSSRSTSSAVPSSSNARIQIFADPMGSESQATEASPNTWTDLGTRKTMIKENVPEIKKLAGTTLKHTGKSKRSTAASSSGPGSGIGTDAASSSSGSKLSIFRDPASEETPTPSSGLALKSAITKAGTASRGPSKKSTLVPGEGHGKAAGNATHPSTSRFTPFRDESTAAAPPSSTLPAPVSVMKIKEAAGKGPGSVTEMEALRRDPLKNHPELGLEDGS